MAQGKPFSEEERAELTDIIIERLLSGESLKHICESDPTLPKRSTIIKWANADDDLSATIARAREMQADALDDEIQSIVERMLRGEIEHNAARVAIWAAQWRAGRMRPKKYGDKITHSGDADAPLAITTIERVVVHPKDKGES